MRTCTKKGVERCDAPFCDKDHSELMLSVWKDRSGDTVETFCLDHWTAAQFAAFRAIVDSSLPAVPTGGVTPSRCTVAKQAPLKRTATREAKSIDEAVGVSIEDLKRILHRPSRIFHVLHSIFGAEGIKRFYSKDAIRQHRQRLRDAGFDYPVRSVPTGPRQPRVVRDLSMGPSRPRRSKITESNRRQSAVPSNTAL